MWGKLRLLHGTCICRAVCCLNPCLLTYGALVQREERVVLGTDIHWMQPVVEAQGIKQLYAEFVHIDVAVLEVTSHT